MTRFASVAKLSMPRVAGALLRPRLFRMLDDAFARASALWLSAPGGSGKTVLMGTWIQQRGCSSLWFQMDAGDIDPSGFFYYLGQAVARAAPRFRKPMPLFTAEYQGSLPLFTRRYFEEMVRRLPKPSVIVFDNCESVDRNTQLMEALAIGAETLPADIAMAFISRHDAPPAFIRLGLNGRLATLGWEEIKTTPPEAEEIVALRGCRPADTGWLVERAEGWMAGLVLMLEQWRRGGDIAPLEDTSPQVLFDFFSHDIFLAMPEEARLLLLNTVFLPDVSVAAAERLSGNADAGRVLAELCRRNFFTERLAGPGRVYRYHPLFRQFLVEQCMERLTAAQIARARRESACLLTADGIHDEAAHLLIDAEEFDGALELLLTQAPAFLAQGRSRTLLELFGRLPESVCAATPWCSHWRGLATLAFDPAAARTLFATGFDQFKARGDLTGMLYCWSSLVETVFFEWDNFLQLDPWIEWLAGVAPEDLARQEPALGLRIASAMLAAQTMRGGNAASMRDWAMRTVRAVVLVPDIQPRLNALIYCINYITWVEPLDLDVSVIETSLRDAESVDLPPLLRLTATYSRAAMQLGQSPDMRHLLGEVHAALALADETGVHVWDEVFCGLGVYAAVVLGEAGAAADLLEKMRLIVTPARRQGLAFHYYIGAMNQLAFGTVEQARKLIMQALLLYAETGYDFPSNVAHYGAAVILAEYGELDLALAEARNADAAAERYEASFMRYATLLCLAFVHLRRGEAGETGKALGEALCIARRLGCRLPLWWWHAPMMTELMAFAIAENIEADCAIDLVKYFGLRPVEPHAAPACWPWPVRISVLGRFEIQVAGVPLEAGRKSPQKPLALLKVLAAAGQDGVGMARLAHQIWPDADGDKAHHALEMTVLRARKLLGREDALHIGQGRVCFNNTVCRVDSHAFGSLVDAGLAALTARCDEDARICLERALDMYRGPLLADDEDNWVLVARDRLRLKHLVVLEKLAGLHEAGGRAEKMLDVYRRAAGVDEFSEELNRRYIACCLALGRHSEAAIATRRLAQARQAEMGIVANR
jgi:LuxR family maltose regulon positive regulatory protein